jgi:hypothetical protein
MYPRQFTQKSSVVVSEAGVSRMCSGRGSFHRKIQVKSSLIPEFIPYARATDILITHFIYTAKRHYDRYNNARTRTEGGDARNRNSSTALAPGRHTTRSTLTLHADAPTCANERRARHCSIGHCTAMWMCAPHRAPRPTARTSRAVFTSSLLDCPSPGPSRQSAREVG